MPQSIIERQQPKYGQGSIRGLTNTEKRKLRRQNTKDAGKGALSSIYNAITDLPSRLARVPAAGVDQIAGTDIQGAIEDLQSAPSQALRNSASNTKAFDKGSNVADAGIMAAALLGAGRMGGTSNTVKSSGVRQPLTNEMMNLERINEALKNTNTPKYVEMTNNPKNVSKGFTRTELGDGYQGLSTKDMPAYAQKRVSNMYNESHPEGPRKADFAGVTKEGELPNNGVFTRYIPDKWQELADINKASRELGVSKDTLRNAQDYLNNARGGDWSIKETADYLKNTSRARANKLKNSNRSRAERTLLKKTERDAEQAVNDVNNLSLEKMYNQWKALNKQ